MNLFRQDYQILRSNPNFRKIFWMQILFNLLLTMISTTLNYWFGWLGGNIIAVVLVYLLTFLNFQGLLYAMDKRHHEYSIGNLIDFSLFGLQYWKKTILIFLACYIGIQIIIALLGGFFLISLVGLAFENFFYVFGSNTDFAPLIIYGSISLLLFLIIVFLHQFSTFLCLQLMWQKLKDIRFSLNKTVLYSLVGVLIVFVISLLLIIFGVALYAVELLIASNNFLIELFFVIFSVFGLIVIGIILVIGWIIYQLMFIQQLVMTQPLKRVYENETERDL